MASAKNIRIKPISPRAARNIIRKNHYSGGVVSNSQLHLGVFLNGHAEGAMQFGPSMDKRKVLGLVKGTKWNGFMELNRMAFSDKLPRNSESRAMAIAFRLIRKHYPHIKWVISFADATQCGDGTIYRAAGFALTAINQSKNLVKLPSGDVIHKLTLESSPTAPRPELGGRSYYDVTGGRYNLGKYAEVTGGQVLPGYQFRYIYFLDPAYREHLTVPEIPYSEIPPEARMYLGRRMIE